MPDFWEFPTVSMGIGPMNAIYQAQFNQYLHNRGIKDTSDQHVWAFLGDGEMDEPESRGLLQLAASEELDNLTFVINCNLQRLDGPVRGNGKIIQELEAFFRGAGWNVIKVVWGRGWDPLLAADGDGALVHLMNATSDGDYQTFRANDGKYVRDHFFDRDPRTRKMVADWSDDEIWWNLKRGGHDYRKVYAAYKAATEHTGQPTVILAKTIKGYGLGQRFAGPQRDAPDEEVHPRGPQGLPRQPAAPDQRRAARGGPLQRAVLPPGPGRRGDPVRPRAPRRSSAAVLPQRRTKHAPVHLPDDSAYAQVKKGSGKQQVATTMAFVRLLKDLMRDKEFGQRIVPIIPDEARTFGMDAFFPTIKIYNPHGQNYTPVDAELMLAYSEAKDGQILHLGINEAGSVAAFTAAGTSLRHARRADDPDLRLLLDVRLPAHRRLDLGGRRPDDPRLPHRRHRRSHHADRRGPAARRRPLPAAGVDQPRGRALRPGVRATRSRTSCRTACTGCTAPTTAHRRPSERHLLPHRLQRADRCSRPSPSDVDVEGILRGHLPLRRGLAEGLPDDAPRVQLLASGVGVPWALEAQQLLADDWGVAADVWSVTSWNELRRDGLRCRRGRLPPPRGRGAGRRASPSSSPAARARSWRCPTTCGPCQDQIRQWVPGRLRLARRRRLRLLRHPAGGAPLLPHRRPVGGGAGAAALAKGARSTPTSARRGRDDRLADVTAGLRQRGRRQLTARSSPPPARKSDPSARVRVACARDAYLGADGSAAVCDPGRPGSRPDAIAARDMQILYSLASCPRSSRPCPSASASASPSPGVSTPPWPSRGCARRGPCRAPTRPTSASTTSPRSTPCPTAPASTAPSWPASSTAAARWSRRACRRSPAAPSTSAPAARRTSTPLPWAAPSPARCSCAPCTPTGSRSGATARPSRATTSSGSTATACSPTPTCASTSRGSTPTSSPSSAAATR